MNLYHPTPRLIRRTWRPRRVRRYLRAKSQLLSNGIRSPVLVAKHAGLDGEQESDGRWWILAVLATVQLMLILDTTIVNIALPTVQRALRFSDPDRQWIVTAYSLAFGSLLLVGGRISDVIGRKRTLILGLVGFVVASALGGVADSFTMLVIARTIQGAFAALLAPVVLALLTTTFTGRKERGLAFGIYGAIAGAGGAIGLLLGGVLTSYVSWRWTLFVNLVLAPVPIVGAVLWLKDERVTEHDPLDLFSIVLATGGLFSLVFGFSHAQSTSWGDHYTQGFLALGAALLCAFFFRQISMEHPLLPLRVLANRMRSASLLTVLLAGAGTFGIFLFTTYYFETTLGYSPVRTGLAFLPLVCALVLAAQISNGLLLAKLGPKLLVPTGMLLAAVALFELHSVGSHSSYSTALLPALIAIGAGLGLSVAPSFSLATLGVEPRDAGVGSATVGTAQQIGGSIGTSLLNTLAGSATAAYLSGKTATPSVERMAALHGYTTAFLCSSGIFLIGAVLAAWVFPLEIPKKLYDLKSPT